MVLKFPCIFVRKHRKRLRSGDLFTASSAWLVNIWFNFGKTSLVHFYILFSAAATWCQIGSCSVDAFGGCCSIPYRLWIPKKKKNSNVLYRFVLCKLYYPPLDSQRVLWIYYEFDYRTLVFQCRLWQLVLLSFSKSENSQQNVADQLDYRMHQADSDFHQKLNELVVFTWRH